MVMQLMLISIYLFHHPNQLDSIQVPRPEFSCPGPRVFVPVPVVVLGRADLGTKERSSDRRMRVQGGALHEESPGSVNDLSPTLYMQDLAIERVLVADNLNAGRQFPHPLAVYLDPHFLVDDAVMQYTRHVDHVALGAESLCKSTFLSRSHLRASGSHSTFPIGPEQVLGGQCSQVASAEERESRPSAPIPMDSLDLLLPETQTSPSC